MYRLHLAVTRTRNPELAYFLATMPDAKGILKEAIAAIIRKQKYEFRLDISQTESDSVPIPDHTRIQIYFSEKKDLDVIEALKSMEKGRRSAFAVAVFYHCAIDVFGYEIASECINEITPGPYYQMPNNKLATETQQAIEPPITDTTEMPAAPPIPKHVQNEEINEDQPFDPFSIVA